MTREEREESERQPRARRRPSFHPLLYPPRAPSATSGIDEIDCGGCISKRSAPPRGVEARGEGKTGMLRITPPRPPHHALSLAAKTQRGEKTLLLAVTLARVPTTFSTSPSSTGSSTLAPTAAASEPTLAIPPARVMQPPEG